MHNFNYLLTFDHALSEEIDKIMHMLVSEDGVSHFSPELVKELQELVNLKNSLFRVHKFASSV